MLLKEIWLDRWFTYALGEPLKLGPGLTFVTGLNGAGKSSIYEALCWTLYGETVRGGKVRVGHTGAKFELEGNEYHAGGTFEVERTKDGRSGKLHLNDSVADFTKATPTETQQVINLLCGDSTSFFNSRVFARDLLAKFALATDKERKALIEGMLGLQQFDQALELARADLAEAKRKRDKLDALTPLLAQKGKDLHERLDKLHSTQYPAAADIQKEIDDVAARHKLGKEARAAIDIQLEQTAARVTYTRTECTVLRGDIDRKTDEAVAAERKLATMGACPTCKRPYDEASLKEAKDELETIAYVARDTANTKAAQLKRAELAKAVAQEEYVELAEVAQENSRAQTSLRERHAALKVELEQAKRFEQDEQELQDKLTQHLIEKASHADTLKAATDEQNLRQAAVEGLGLRGARNMLLGDALGEVSARANAVLTRLGGDFKLNIEGTTTRADGREVDAVSIEVQGAGGGEYRGCSGGQRVKIDVALMLGLAAAQGSSGLLIFDEVFDSLDAEGTERVAEYVAELARERQVLVISHSEALAALLPGATKLRAVYEPGYGSRLESA